LARACRLRGVAIPAAAAASGTGSSRTASRSAGSITRRRPSVVALRRPLRIPATYRFGAASRPGSPLPRRSASIGSYAALRRFAPGPGGRIGLLIGCRTGHGAHAAPTLASQRPVRSTSPTRWKQRQRIDEHLTLAADAFPDTRGVVRTTDLSRVNRELGVALERPLTEIDHARTYGTADGNEVLEAMQAVPRPSIAVRISRLRDNPLTANPPRR